MIAIWFDGLNTSTSVWFADLSAQTNGNGKSSCIVVQKFANSDDVDGTTCNQRPAKPWSTVLWRFVFWMMRVSALYLFGQHRTTMFRILISCSDNPNVFEFRCLLLCSVRGLAAVPRSHFWFRCQRCPNSVYVSNQRI